MRALALDVGSKTIGMALSDPGGVIASAWGVLERQGHVLDAKEVVRRVEAEEVECVVVGLPLELNGSEGHRARLTRRFLDVLQTELERNAQDEAPVAVDTARGQPTARALLGRLVDDEDPHALAPLESSDDRAELLDRSVEATRPCLRVVGPGQPRGGVGLPLRRPAKASCGGRPLSHGSA